MKAVRGDGDLGGVGGGDFVVRERIERGGGRGPIVRDLLESSSTLVVGIGHRRRGCAI